MQRVAALSVLASVAGIAAGTLATVAQLILWWLADMAPVDTLLRDARLTAALLMGRAVLSPGVAATWLILLVATLIHFTLSVLYAIVPAYGCECLGLRGVRGPRWDLLAGAAYGLLIYAVNLYGFTLLFPWFAQVRDGVTLAAHVVFGLILVATCRLWRRAGPRDVNLSH